MALPIILINSATGSDTAASGAGPTTALTGAAGVTSASGLVVTLDGSPDLTGVATDGSHVLFMSDTNAGSRNFGKITAKANSGTPTAEVTVADAFQATNTDAWAIGGKRASLGSTTSKKLVDNNGGNGDWLPGWVIEMESGHSETIAATLDLRRAGDTTNGPLILRGTAGAATLPLLTFSNNGNAIVARGAFQQCRAFEIRNSNGTKTASVALTTTAAETAFELIKVAHSTNKFWKGHSSGTPVGLRIISCEFGYLANVGIEVQSGPTFVLGCRFINNYVHDCGATAGIDFLLNHYLGLVIKNNLVYNNVGIGIRLNNDRDEETGNTEIAHNTIDLSTSDGLQVIGAFKGNFITDIINNIFSNNGGYGLQYNSSGFTDVVLAAYGVFVRGNQTFNNASGAYKSNTAGYAYNTCPWASGDTGLNPTYTAISTGNAALGTNLKAQGWPVGGSVPVGGTSTTYSYVDPGAAQRQESGGGGGVIAHSLIAGAA